MMSITACCKQGANVMTSKSIRVTYRLETSGSIESLAAKIASDQSTGTFTELPGETAEFGRAVPPRSS